MNLSVKRFLLLSAILLASIRVFAAIELHEFNNDVDRQRYQSFIEEMRCPKCQNQNLAGSDSPISADLRRQVYEMIKAGKSDKEIVDFMVERYGEFILYRPRVMPATYALWGAPIGLLIVGGVVLMLILRRRRQLAASKASTALSLDEQRRLANLLNSTHDSQSTKEPRR